jgi:hypothetical protein
MRAEPPAHEDPTVVLVGALEERLPQDRIVDIRGLTHHVRELEAAGERDQVVHRGPRHYGADSTAPRGGGESIRIHVGGVHPAQIERNLAIGRCCKGNGQAARNGKGSGKTSTMARHGSLLDAPRGK